MKKISFTSFFNMLFIGFTMLTSTYAYAGNLGDVINNYIIGRQINNPNSNLAITKGVIDNYTDNNQIRLRGIELTTEWQQIYQMTQDATQKVDENLMNAGQRFDFCANPNILLQLTENTRSFDYNYNRKLPHQASNPSQIYDYSTFTELNRFNRNFTGVEPIQIPNANAISNAMGSRNDNVIQNSSAIMLPKVLLNEIRNQYALTGRNAMVDSRDMYTATLRDITTIGYLIQKNPQLNLNFDDFFVTSMLIYTRNKILCIYDAPLKYNIR